MPGIPIRSKCSYVYALCEPDKEFAPRYVGVTTNPVQRFLCHTRKSGILLVRSWIASGVCPRMVILQTLPNCYIGAALSAEKWWILHLLSQGHELFNRASTRDSEAEVRAMWTRRITAKRVRSWFKIPHRGLRDSPNLRHLEHDGRVLTMSMWARELGITRQALHLRLKKYPVDVALSTARGETPEQATRALEEARQQRASRRAIEAAAIRAQRVARIGKSRIVQLSHAERRLRRQEMASEIARGESIEATAQRFGVTTATVRNSTKELSSV